MKRPGRGARQRNVLPPSLLRKQLLLPLPDPYVQEVSLMSHLALEGCRAEAGNRHLVNALIWTSYLSFYLWQAGIGAASMEVFQCVETTLDRVAVRGNESGIWRIADEEMTPVTRILCLYDQQLLSVHTGVFLESRQRLERLLSLDGSASPIQNRCIQQDRRDASEVANTCL